MKRFYRDVAVTSTEDGYQTELDGRPVKTQGGQPQRVPSRALAERLAAEWEHQGEEIDPHAFVLRDLVDYSLDIVPGARAATITKLLRYAETDTLCYRAEPDEPLWHRQREIWDPLLEALEAREGVTLERVSGIIHRPHSRDALARLQARLETYDDFMLATLEMATSLAASLCIGLAALEPDADGDALWNAANLEEDWQAENWGVDEQAAELREKRRRDFLQTIEFAQIARS
ncbi:ATP12 family chaperone protein [Qipengyuania zhejiangensis]|uniref:ATP12 family chaperone protein n=1 Tax=Qipengyuania zhejiangensis TaxID=3077782 RepID=UPI002D7742C6|nr:ATP12 family protein [Qipengyuania sp. Z2]